MTALFRWPGGWDPMGTLRHVQREMDRVFGRMGLPESGRVGGGSFPPVNVFNGPDDLVVQCELAGVAKDALDLSITGETLVIKGEKTAPEEENVRYHRRERGYGQFQRTIVLPDRVDPDKADANLDGGVLTVRLPKSEAAKPKQISVS